MFRNLTRRINNNVLRPNTIQLSSKENVYTNNSNISRKITSHQRQIDYRLLHRTTSKYVKQFIGYENNYAHKILQTIPIATYLADIKIQSNKSITTEHDFNDFLDQNWRSASPTDVATAFLNVVNYCKQANINLADHRFDKLVDGLMDTVDKLTTDELYTLLECLIGFPQTEAYNSHNYHDVWSALDDICCRNLRNWDIETLFQFANLFYRLHLARIGDYVFCFLDRVSRKPGKLTAEQLVHVFFYMNACRKRPVEFEFESAIESKLDRFTLDEMSVIAMGFFKSQSKIKLAPILNRMLELVVENSQTVHEITLAAIVKIVRLSQHPQTQENVLKMLDKITPEIPRLSHLCATHVALVCTSLQLFHEPVLDAVAQKTIDSISDIEVVRLKDIERLLFAMTLYDYDPKTTRDFYKTLLQELRREERMPEKLLHPKCLPTALSFLCIRNIYSEELMEGVLKPEFTWETYGKNSKLYPREIFVLNLSSEIDFPEYRGSRWPSDMRRKACKWLMEYVPEESYKKLTAANKLIADVSESVLKVTGDKKYLYIGHVLPQYVKPDVVLCVDRDTNEFVEPTCLLDYSIEEIKHPKQLDKYKWYCLIVVSFNLCVRNTLKPVGIVNMKERQLRSVGYEPILVMWNEYNWLQNEEKVDYILNKLKRL